MKLAIMQPYFFPYIGYFQLIKSVNKFIFYDDVNYIKNGWINRNRILINKEPKYITLPIKNASSFTLIKDVQFVDKRDKIKKMIEVTYRKAPFYNEIAPVIFNCIDYDTSYISELAVQTVRSICDYLNYNVIFEISSLNYYSTKHLKNIDRLIEICKSNKTEIYVNPIGGMELYSKEIFEHYGIDLFFVKSTFIEYKQLSDSFYPNLSIIDVLMNCGKEKTIKILNEYELI